MSLWSSLQETSSVSNPASVSKTVVPVAIRHSMILTAGGSLSLPERPKRWFLPQRRNQRDKVNQVRKFTVNKRWVGKALRTLLPTTFFIYVFYPVSTLLFFRLPEQLSWLGVFQYNHQCQATLPRHIIACFKLKLAQLTLFLPWIGAIWLWGFASMSKVAKSKLSLTLFLVGMGIFKLCVDHVLLFDDRSSLTGKVAIITGANRGIGRATALALAKRGAHVVLTCRSLAKCQPVVDQISKAGKGSASSAVLELSSLESAGKLAQYLSMEYPEIHYFFANAGTTPQYELTNEGFEDGFGGMHLAHMAVVLGILPNLQRGGTSAENPSRVVVVSSEMSINAAMGIFGNNLMFSTSTSSPEADLEDDWRGEITRGDGTIGSSLPAYGRAKLCGILFAFELNRRLKQQNVPVIAHAVHVGAVVTDTSRTSIVQGFPNWIPGLRWITGSLFFPFLWRNVEGGSRALLCPALSQAQYIVQGGQYLDALCRPFFHDRDPNPKREKESTLTLPQFLAGHQHQHRTKIQIDPVQALLLADIRWSARLWNVSLAFLTNSPASHTVAFAP